MKKILSVVLSVLLMLTSGISVAYAAADATVEISRVTALPGDKVEVYFSFDCPDGVKTLSFFDFKYDNSVLSVVESECKWLADGLLKDIDFKNSASIITFSKNTAFSDNMLKLVFVVSGNAKNGSYPVSCSARGTRMIENVETKINISVSAGAITVKKASGQDDNTQNNNGADDKCIHNYKAVVTTPANCINAGAMKYTCTLCGDSYNEKIPVDAYNHAGPTEIRDAVTANCKDKGYTGDTYCTACNRKTADGTELPATENHKFSDWVVISVPTAGKNGTKERQCSVCEKKETCTFETVSNIPGDVNFDGSVSASDARTILRTAAKLEQLSDEQLEAADINGDLVITAFDARIALRISAKVDSVDNYIRS